METNRISRFWGNVGERKLLSLTLVLFTLAIGIIIGTTISTKVDAARDGRAVAPDAKPLTIPDPLPLENEFTKIAKQVRPSVVNIQVEALPRQQTSQRRSPQERNRADDFFRRFFGLPDGPPGEGPFGDDRGRRRPGEGSGVIVDPNGYIITNYHVVEDADRIRVRLFDESKNGEKLYEAKLIGSDPETDLAVVKIDAKKTLVPAKIGNADAVNVGDWAIAVGSPFGFRESVTVGIVSAKGREVQEGKPNSFKKFIQTDAAINPGNSGGPLLNIRGEVIGINTAIVSRSGGYEGLGFALASNIAVNVYNQIIQGGKVTRGSIGIKFPPDQEASLLRAYGAQEGGVLVSEVVKGGPAEKAGMKAEDVIVEIGGKPVQTGDELIYIVAATPIDSTIPVVVLRDGQRQTLQVRIADRAELFPELGLAQTPEAGEIEGTEVMFGIAVSNLTKAQREQLEFPGSDGVLVTDVEPASFAADIGVQPNDVIVSINRKTVSSLDDIRSLQGSLKPGDDVAFKIMRRNPAGGDENPWTTLYVAGVLPEASRDSL
jgi:serine protease Do